MAHIYKASTWESVSGNWHCNDVEESLKVSVASKWWVPCRILQLSYKDYIILLKDKFNATGFDFSKEYNVLHFYFTNKKDANTYKNFINKKARERNFVC